ncbi:DNA mismatch repair endonuclease MutL [Methanoregula formicica]|uniref:DNA mismatch repair protein MutL n=1 Tax=Methanoregula formicica (strain DSM 22288 / NBRC 105244 / SMSP) TaxID=593750 RepID=L0HCN9_METFS|nr:DNA mismatch repair endonuclease MutL [Methanoregula formicica]AGB02502.1 DNA mismatch repair protein MutL [Methanoregula formicica SMSP]
MKQGSSPTIIRVLDQATVNKIAAGEVVERPASLVKELVENSIDAGADSVRIEIIASKNEITSIRITDDGCGMVPEDALLAFTPHATSKITEIRDLDTIRTLGFRGEALASIAAVARVTLITRPRDDELAAGTRIVIAGGEILENSAIGAPGGTTVLVEDLFYNTPARKKFQKSRATELAHIIGMLEGIILAHPTIAFRLTYNGTEQVVTGRNATRLDTIARIYGAATARDLVPVSTTAPLVAIAGHISRPSLSRKDRDRIILSINGRYVSSPAITNAIKEGYGTLLPKDRFPVAFLSLDIDTALVDVNVHPTKKLVRISREPEIAGAVRDAIKKTLAGHDLIPDIRPTTAPQPIVADAPAAMAALSRSFPYQFPETKPPVVSEPTHSGVTDSDRRLRHTELAPAGPAPAATLPPLRVIGEFGGIYILATNASGELLIIDQHAAHERILYELAGQQDGSGKRVQELIAPVILHRTPRESAVLAELLPALRNEGFQIEEFGKDTFLVRTVPIVLGKLEDTSLLEDIISDLVSTDRGERVDNRERITRIVACRGAIKAGTVCTPEQCQRVADQLRFTKNPFTCPHGRPTIIRFTREQLDGMFKRS